jgi:MFS-type transporter involved in bile tolerance (Atg22 family)
MRKTLTTATLVIILSCPAFAGIMHTPGEPEPPSDSTQSQSTNSSTSATSNLIQTVLAVIVSVLH